MGAYINTPTSRAIGKADDLIENYGGRELPERPSAIGNLDPDEVLVAVVDNGAFDAAMVCYNGGQFDRTGNPSDPRPARYIVVKREAIIDYVDEPYRELVR
jgi:predicted Zn-dependent protease with MMP-like domain